MVEIVRRIHFHKDLPHEPASSMDKEWLLTNGLGGYSSLSLIGSPLRKYHGWLVASFAAPLGRTLMLNFVADYLLLPNGQKVALSALDSYEEPESIHSVPLIEFRLEDGLPVWIYEIGEVQIEKRAFLAYMQNTIYFSYRYLKGAAPLKLHFRPYFQFRHHEATPSSLEGLSLTVKLFEDGITQIKSDELPPLFLYCKAAHFTLDSHLLMKVRYRYEEERGYDSVGSLSSPGFYEIPLSVDEPITLVGSIENLTFSYDKALEMEKQRRENLITHTPLKTTPFLKELLLAADQFLIVPASRLQDIMATRAIGEEARTIIAGYPWFTDWGRDLMISLEGLMLIPGRYQEAKECLNTYLRHLKEGLIPNMFPDGENKGRYNTADATLWFFHTLDRYLCYTQDETFLKDHLKDIEQILHYHINGTLFGIQVDPEDGLLIQGEKGVALTWMDAVVGDLVVTPRRGKAVEISALWYNALKLAIEWLKKEHQDTDHLEKWAEKTYTSFNEKFWSAERGYLLDVIEGESGSDSSCRPNQLFALSLKYPVLKKEYWESVLNTVQDKLLTPYGLRTLSSGHPDYKVVYKGNLFLRDSSYHQGTVWPWLLGPFMDAWLKVYPDRKKELFKLLDFFDHHLYEACVGSISEIFDAENPYIHRGCFAQAWSVAEILRMYVKLI